MISDFFAWYKTLTDNWRSGLSDLESGADLARVILGKNRGYISLNGRGYFLKTPHSRTFKKNKMSPALSNRDNKLAVSSELLAEKKYLALGFMAAPHVVIKKIALQQNVICSMYDDCYAVISPILFNSEVFYATMYELQEYEKMINPDFDIEETMFGSFEKAIENKDIFLKYMTEECYDEYIKYCLLSMFEFSDDEHLGNIILCHNKKADKFEHLFIYDKESTGFNPLIARGYTVKEIVEGVKEFSAYNGSPFFFKGEKTFERIAMLTKMVAEGRLPQKYCDFLSEISQLDYQKFALDVYEETGVKVAQSQVDMYKYGAELAGQIALKN